MDAMTLLDLDRLGSQDRTAAWSNAVPSFFPGATVDEWHEEPRVGVIKGAELGSARVFEIDSGPVTVGYLPARASPVNQQTFSIMLQRVGTTSASQHRRASDLEEGDLCLIDNEAPFRLRVKSAHSSFLFVQLPRSMVLNRHPHLRTMTAAPLCSDEAGAKLLKSTLLAVLQAAPQLGASEQWNAVSMLISALGLLRANETASDSNAWRVRRALAFIEAHAAEPLLRADDVALEQSISRRQLDRIFEKALGLTVASHISEQRLEHAAALLAASSPARTTSVTRAALASGFQDASHFSRAFKKRFGVPPGKWAELQAQRVGHLVRAVGRSPSSGCCVAATESVCPCES